MVLAIIIWRIGMNPDELFRTITLNQRFDTMLILSTTVPSKMNIAVYLIKIRFILVFNIVHHLPKIIC